MAKEIKAKIKLANSRRRSNASSSSWFSILVNIGVTLWNFVSNLMLKQQVRKGETVPVVITVYTDKTFNFVVKTPPATELIKKKINLAKGSSQS